MKPMRRSLVKLLIAGGLATALTACEAQKPTPLALPGGTPQFSEPALIGKIVDAETKRPIQGAFVYGHYATSTGTLAGGSTFGEHVKSFSVETDANGQFKLDAWSTGDRKIGGQANGKFPMIAVYKPGYVFAHQNLNSISQWTAMSSNGASKATLTERGVDWTGFPYELTPAKTEKDRYFALSNSGVPMMMVGECGWELYSGLLLAMHDELKEFIARNVDPSNIDGDGYIKSGRPWPDVPFGNFNRTFVDRLKLDYAKNSSNWKCANPNQLLSVKK
jgi:hypothetical protein